jgi:ribonuclease HI
MWILAGGCIPLRKTPLVPYRARNPVSLTERRGVPRYKAPTSIFTSGDSVQPGFDRKDSISASHAYYEFKNIESQLTQDTDCILVYTDGSYKDGISGSGAVIYRNTEKIHEISSPNGRTSIMFAELFAILSVLRWLGHSRRLDDISDVHFFTDSASVRIALCETVILRSHFFLIQEIKHLAASLSHQHNFTIHWIPSHIDKYTNKRFAIAGNLCADILSKQGQQLAEDLPEISNIEHIREKILEESVLLVWSISRLLNNSNFSSDGPSSDDFSSANANGNI